MWKRIFRKDFFNLYRSICSSSDERFTNDLLRKRVTRYVDRTSYVDELSETIPRLKQYRKASILLPLYCNEKTNRVEILVLKRSDKIRSYTGMIAFPGGLTDPTDRDTIHTAEREAEEEIGLKPEHYSILGCLPPITDSRIVMITPVIALLDSSKFMDFRLSLDEVCDAFYLDLEQFLYRKNNYKMMEVSDSFITHYFDIDKHRIWGVTAYYLIVIATLVFQKLPEYPFFRHEQQLDLQILTKQLKEHFHLCVNHVNPDEIKNHADDISRLLR